MAGFLFLFCMLLMFPRAAGKWLAEARAAYEFYIDEARTKELKRRALVPSRKFGGGA
jgi:hypothetical protein